MGKLQMWETDRSAPWRAITSLYYRHSHGILMVIELTNKKSFSDMEQSLYERDQKLLIANKYDIINKVDSDKKRIEHDPLLVAGYFKGFDKNCPSCLIQICLQYVYVESVIPTENHISQDEVEKFCRDLNMDFITTSAKSGKNIEDAVTRISLKMKNTEYKDMIMQQKVRNGNDRTGETKMTPLQGKLILRETLHMRLAMNFRDLLGLHVVIG